MSPSCRLHFSIRSSALRQEMDLSLCLVTERKCIRSDDVFISKIMRAIQGGATCIQLRDRNEDLQACLRTAYRLKDLMRSSGVPLIINNRLDVALAVGADGVHIGQKDFPYRDARRLMGPQALIGLTVDTLDDVHAAEPLDVDYLGIQLFPSQNTKPDHTHLWGLAGLRKIRSISRHRLVVIGGINLNNLKSICAGLHIGKNKDGIAMVGELWRGNDPYPVAQKIRAIFNGIISSQHTDNI